MIKSPYYIIKQSKITPEISNHVTKKFIYGCWSLILKEVNYASQAINLIENKNIYQKNKLLIDSNSPLIKPDHTASRGFISNNMSSSFYKIDPLKLNYDDLKQEFHPLTGTCLSTIILQMLGAKFASEIYNFPIYNAKGTNLFFHHNNDINIQKTKHFVSNQNIDKLPNEIKKPLLKELKNYTLTISPDDWEILKQIYAGKNISKDNLQDLLTNLPNKILGRSWNITSNTAELLSNGSKNNSKHKKPIEYAYSTYLRGNWINHGTWRVSDIFRGYGILQHLGTNPVPIRGLNTTLEQTAGMADNTDYQLNNGKTIKGPGAFLEIASRPYALLNSHNHPVNHMLEEVNLTGSSQPLLFKELSIELDPQKWVDNKIFLDNNNNPVSLTEINSGIYGKNTKLISKNRTALCYEGFKESNATGIFFAAGGSK